ncbi:MAG: acetylxylan esterase, partial [Collinsella sp.]
MPSAQELQQQFGEYRGAMPRPSDFDLFWKDRMAEADAVGLDYAIETASVNDAATCQLFDLWYTGMCGARLHAKYLQ